MKIKQNFDLKQLEKLGYDYQENLLFPTYRRVTRQGKKRVVIEILVQDRTVFINKNKKILEPQKNLLCNLKKLGILLDEK